MPFCLILMFWTVHKVDPKVLYILCNCSITKPNHLSFWNFVLWQGLIKFHRLAWICHPLFSASQVAGIIVLHDHAWLYIWIFINRIIYIYLISILCLWDLSTFLPLQFVHFTLCNISMCDNNVIYVLFNYLCNIVFRFYLSKVWLRIIFYLSFNEHAISHYRACTY